MKKLLNVVSLIKPKFVEDLGDVVKIRENIKDIHVTDDVFEDTKPAFMYDELKLSKEEYKDMEIEKRVDALEEDMKIVQLAIAEFIGNSCEPMAAVATIYTQYSAISQMYANMIQKGIYTIDRVPALYRKEVLEVLELNEK